MGPNGRTPRLPSRLFGTLGTERAGFVVWAPATVIAEHVIDYLAHNVPSEQIAGRVTLTLPAGGSSQAWWIRSEYKHVRDMYSPALDA